LDFANESISNVGLRLSGSLKLVEELNRIAGLGIAFFTRLNVNFDDAARSPNI
jgi:hypothetical protein